MKQVVAIAIIVLMSISLQAQQYKFKKCDNYMFSLEYGYTVNNVIFYGGKGGEIVVDVTADSVKFNTPAISISEDVAFKIMKREEQVDEHGNKLILFVVGDAKTRTVINVVIAGKDLYTSFDY